MAKSLLFSKKARLFRASDSWPASLVPMSLVPGLDAVTIRDAALARGEANRAISARLESGDKMPILVKHSGSVAPALVGAYGGGLGRRYAEQSDDAMRRIHARQMAVSRGGGIVRRVRAGGKSAAQEAAEAEGRVGVGANAGLIGGRPAAGDAFAPLGRWRQPTRPTQRDIALQDQIAKEKRAAEAEQERWERGVKADEAERSAKELERVRLENPFVGIDTSKWDNAKRAEYKKLMGAWNVARSQMEPGPEMQELNRQITAKIAEIEAMPNESKPGVKIEGFGEDITEIAPGTVKRLSDGTIIKNVGNNVDITPPKPEKPEKPERPQFDAKDMVGFIRDAEKEFADAAENDPKAAPASRDKIIARAKQLAKEAMALQAELMGGSVPGAAAQPEIVGQPVQDPESGRWFGQTANGLTVEVQPPKSEISQGDLTGTVAQQQNMQGAVLRQLKDGTFVLVRQNEKGEWEEVQ